jgi:stearoyl-CoA desaturase (delta-9 desaturase)
MQTSTDAVLPDPSPADPLQALGTRVREWVDAGKRSALEKDPAHRVDWIGSLPFLGMHAVCLAVIWVGVSPIAVAVALGSYAMRMLFLATFYHRYFSHRTYRTNRFWQFMFAVAGATCVQRGAIWWAAHHRHHHRVSDEPEDVHSPITQGFLWSHIGWITSPANTKTHWERVPDLAKFPELRFLNRFHLLVPILYAVAMFGLGVVLEPMGLGTNGWQMLIWGFFISTVLLFHGTSTVNSLAHLWGRRRYRTTDHSRNNAVLALITMGEGWHNNHHHYPSTARQGFYWWEVDVGWYFLRTLQALRIIRGLRGVPRHVRDRRP